MDEPLAPPMVWPTVRARDAEGLLVFLTEVLGFEEAVVYREGDLVDTQNLPGHKVVA